MRFAQGIRVRCDDPDALVQLLAEWDRGQATTDVMGYIGTRLLADRDDPGCYLILADFAEVDGDLTPAEEAERNNQREETERWAQQLPRARRAASPSGPTTTSCTAPASPATCAPAERTDRWASATTTASERCRTASTPAGSPTASTRRRATGSARRTAGSSSRATCSSSPPPTPTACRSARTRAASPASCASSTSTRSPSRVYDGNGMFLSTGNIVVNPNVGILFVDFERGSRLRFNGVASVDRRRSADRAATPARSSSCASAATPCSRTAAATCTTTSWSSGHRSCPPPRTEPPVPDWKRDPWFDGTLPDHDPAHDPDRPSGDSIPRF